MAKNAGALEATLVSMQSHQKDMHEQNTRIFGRIMDKLDALPSIQKDIAVINITTINTNDKLSAHMKDDDDNFGEVDKRFDKLENAVEDLKKDNWIRKGISIAAGAMAGFGGSLLHR